MDSSSPVQNSQPTSTPVQSPLASNSQVSSPKQTSSNKGLILSIIIVLVVVVGVGVYAFMSKQSATVSNTSLTSQAKPSIQVSPVPSMTMNQTNQMSVLTSGKTNSDLTQDSNTLNKQLDSANSEMSNVDQGLNDKPSDLSQ